MTNSKMKSYLQPPFLIFVGLLFLACIGKWIVFGGDIFTKTPIDMRKSFDDIDRDKLAPYIVARDDKIKNKDILESLGTEEYIQWVLEDPDVRKNSSVRFCQLFITYYGRPDRVPHVPEECYIGSGSVQEGKKNIAMTLDGYPEQIEIKKLDFKSESADMFATVSRFSRMYFFKVDYDFANSRTSVRAALQKNFGKYSFFSKVEWQFYGRGYNTMITPNEEQIVTASKKLLTKLLPLLEDQHWPDLDELARIDAIAEANTETDVEVN
jgi:hypothetical protein